MGDRTGQRLDSYQLVRLLGTGSFGEVYLAEHLHKNIPVAIKVLPQLTDSDLQSFLNEARTIRLRHPHIVQVLDFGVDNHTPFIVMEYIPNGTLRQRYPKGSRLPLDKIAMYVGQVAQALQYAHNERIIHRDVKPENILLRSDTNVLLSDFGIATMARSTRSQSTQGMAGTVVYMAPEQVQGKPTLASDQYALGIIAYEWLCGERPFNGSPLEIATQHMLAPLPLLHDKIPTISPQIEQVVIVALAKEPNKRFSSVQEFASALDKACKPVKTVSPVPDFLAKPPVISPPSQQSLSLSAPAIGSRSSVKQPYTSPPEVATSRKFPNLSQLALPKIRSTSSNKAGKKIERNRLFYPALILLTVLMLAIAGSGAYYFLTQTSNSSTVDQSLQNTQALIVRATGELQTNPTQALHDLATAQTNLRAIQNGSLTSTQRQKIDSLQSKLRIAVRSAIIAYNQQAAIISLTCASTPSIINTGTTGRQQLQLTAVQGSGANAALSFFVLGNNGAIYQIAGNNLIPLTQLSLPISTTQVIAMASNGPQLLLLTSSAISGTLPQTYALSVFLPGQKKASSTVPVPAQSGSLSLFLTSLGADVYVVMTSSSSTTVSVLDYPLARGKLTNKPLQETLTATNVVSVAAFPQQQLFFLLADGSLHSLQFTGTPGGTTGAFTSVFVSHAVPSPLASGNVSADAFTEQTPVPMASPVSQTGKQPLSIGAGTTSSLVASQTGQTSHLYVMDAHAHRLLDFTEVTPTASSSASPTVTASSGSTGTGGGTVGTATVTADSTSVTLNLEGQYISPMLFTQLKSIAAAPDGSAWYVLSQNASSMLAMITLQIKPGFPVTC